MAILPLCWRSKAFFFFPFNVVALELDTFESSRPATQTFCMTYEDYENSQKKWRNMEMEMDLGRCGGKRNWQTIFQTA